MPASMDALLNSGRPALFVPKGLIANCFEANFLPFFNDKTLVFRSDLLFFFPDLPLKPARLLVLSGLA